MSTVKVEIKSRWDSNTVLFTADVSAEIGEEFRMRAVLEMAVKAGANLAGANLAGANLARANLADANLADANLARANLARANLAYANLADANLADANLAYAKISASLTLIGKRPFFFLGPIGSESRMFHAYITNEGLRLRAGCFFGTRDEFLQKLSATHGTNEHANEYQAALALIDKHVEIWTPAEEKVEAA